MKIKKVSCDQFAGVVNKELELEHGLNIVIGENESGKSTLVDLIYQMLFKDVKLDRRRDSDFIDKYFPKKVKGPQGDVIDGALVFETSDGVYKLKKEWDREDGMCRLFLPDGTSIKANDLINEVLSKELKHRAGVYNEIIFASQKRNQIAVESIMRALGKKSDSLSETREDLTSTLNQAALETGGVSLEKIEKAIKANLDGLIGRWDRAADAPEGGPKRASYKNAWVSGAGRIVKAYYEADEVRARQTDAENAERAVEAEKSAISSLHIKKKKIEADRSEFQKFRGLLGQLSLLNDSIGDIDSKLTEQRESLDKWPGLETDISKAQKLSIMHEQSKIHDLFLKADPAYQICAGKQETLKNLKEVDPTDLKDCRELNSKKQKEESKLAGMNLIARIKELGSSKVQVTSVATGKPLDLNEGKVQITEAVNISVPGVMEMQLMPMGIDAESVKQNITDLEKTIGEIYTRYSVKSFEELQEMSDAYSRGVQEAEKSKLELEKILGEKSFEDLKKENAAVPEGIEPETEIKRQITDLCGSKTIDAYIGGLESTLADYVKKYTGIEELKKSIDDLNHDKVEKQKKLDSMEQIPEEFQGIDDPEQYDADLQAQIEDYENRIREFNEKLSEAERKLGDKSAEEYYDELQDKEADLKALKSEYEHWDHIYNTFCRLKDSTGGNPVDDIETRFREYLEVITDGTLHLNSMDEQLSVELASGNNALTFDTLSDGTKDTISLAFRLAMLEHLSPEGDGLAVFDDPFTDMDEKRMMQSCKLIQKFAENNQVLFITCSDKYKDYLNGNVISLTK